MNIYSIIWNASEWSGIGLGRFAPHVFGKMIGRKMTKVKQIKQYITEERLCRTSQYQLFRYKCRVVFDDDTTGVVYQVRNVINEVIRTDFTKMDKGNE